MEHIFRAYDVRGIYNKDLTPVIAAGIGAAFGTYLGGDARVLIGRDPRTSSPAVEGALMSGLLSTGCDVFTTGMVPIPTSNFKLSRGDFDAGTYITASHNPPEYNGIRFRHPDGSGYTSQNNEIRDIYLNNETKLVSWDRVGKVYRFDPVNIIREYADFLRERFQFQGDLNCVLDPGNGAASHVAPLLFRELGAAVSTINAYPDGTFPGRPSEPNDTTLKDLKDAVIRKEADFGVGFDGDADRCVFVDEKGRTCQTEKIGVVVARDILESHGPGNVIANVECSMMLEQVLPDHGGTVKRVRVGDVFVCEAIKEHGAVFAMETSAHYFMPHLYIFDDPMAVALRLGEILTRSNRPLSELMDEIPSYPKIAEKFQCPDEIKFKVMDLIIDNLKATEYELDLTDGARVIFEDGWALLRPSNTTPLIRCTVEAETPARLTEIKNDMEGEFKRAVGTLQG